MPPSLKALADKRQATRGRRAECNGVDLQIRLPQRGDRVEAVYIRMRVDRVHNCREIEPVRSCDSRQVIGPGTDTESDYCKLKDGLLVLNLWMTTELIPVVDAGIRTLRTASRPRKNRRAAF